MILPMPKGEVAQDDYHSYVNAWADAFVAIPTNADNELAGVVTEALAFWSWKYIRPKSYEMTYKLKTARNDNSAEMLDIVFNTLCLDFNVIYDLGGTYTALRTVTKKSLRASWRKRWIRQTQKRRISSTAGSGITKKRRRAKTLLFLYSLTPNCPPPISVVYSHTMTSPSFS